MSRHAWNLRIRIHDWLWSGGRLRRWIACRTPDYFADPYLDWFKDWKKHPEKWQSVQVVGPRKVRVRTHSGFTRTTNGTASTGASTTLVYNWPPIKSNGE